MSRASGICPAVANRTAPWWLGVLPVGSGGQGNCRTVDIALGGDAADCVDENFRLAYFDLRQIGGQSDTAVARDEAVYEQWAILRINGRPGSRRTRLIAPAASDPAQL